MNFAQTHLDIARERFLELMAAQPGADVQTVAIVAVSQADAFASVYQQYGYKPAEPASTNLKGCGVCFGSGGKRNAPCQTCGGTGKVPA